jgi:hypothetical protein
MMDWNEARDWEKKANKNKEEHMEPKWSFDCGFKLDFDGSFLKVSSRFYPPYKNNGDFWEGFYCVYLYGKEVLRKEFKAKTLDSLRNKVEKYQNSLSVKIEEQNQ